MDSTNFVLMSFSNFHFAQKNDKPNDVSKSMSFTTTPWMDILDLFTSAGVQEFCPDETHDVAGNWRNGFNSIPELLLYQLSFLTFWWVSLDI